MAHNILKNWNTGGLVIFISFYAKEAIIVVYFFLLPFLFFSEIRNKYFFCASKFKVHLLCFQGQYITECTSVCYYYGFKVDD